MDRRTLTAALRAKAQGLVAGFALFVIGGILLPVSRDPSPVVVMEATSPDARPALYISDGGEISCLAHAPYQGSDSWHFERWHTLTAAEARDFERGVRRAPACETCLAIARRGGPR